MVNRINKEALKNSILTTLYISLVGGGMFYVSTIKKGPDNTFLAPIAFLLLFVLSASITGFLVLGKPVQLYIDGKKKEGISLLFSTITYLAVITIIALGSLILFT